MADDEIFWRRAIFDSILKLGLQADSVFSGISTFGRLPYFPCLASDEEKFDIAFLGRGSHCSTDILSTIGVDVLFFIH